MLDALWGFGISFHSFAVEGLLGSCHQLTWISCLSRWHLEKSYPTFSINASMNFH